MKLDASTGHRFALIVIASAALAACGTLHKPADKAPAVTLPVGGALVFAVPQPGGTTVQGGQYEAFAYSEKPGDAKLDQVAVAAGVARVTGSLWAQKGSTWGGIGFTSSPGAPGKTADLSAQRSLRIQLASTTATHLRLRVVGSDQATREAGCYPVALVPVSAELREHTIPLSGFAPEGYCEARGKSIASTAPAVAAIEVSDATVAGTRRAVDFQVGRIELRP
jgi:hypothetical protein